VLSGLLLNVALYAVVRCKVLVEGSLQTSFAKELMMGFGLLSVVVAAFLLSRKKDIKRLFGVLVDRAHGNHHLCVGMGGPIANFAGPVAHDGPFAHQSRRFLCCGPCDAENRHAS